MKIINKLNNPLLNIVREFKSILNKTSTQKQSHPFWVMVQKETADHVRSWRFIILLILIAFTCFGTLYNSMSHLNEALSNSKDPNNMFAFLKLLTATDGSLPSYYVFIGFLGPLLGISLGFDAINSEHNNGSLVRVISQPIHRDYIINSKFTSALIIISTLFFTLSFLFVGFGILVSGLTPSFSEFLRIIAFTLLSILYVAFWLNLSILFSIKFRQAATSALTSIAVWLFFTIFYQILINIVAKAFIPSKGANMAQIFNYKKFFMGIMNISPNQLFTDASTTLLIPSIRSLGPLSFSQTQGAIPSALSLRDSLIIVWPQLTGLIAATVLCFALSYYLFMKREIRA
ncbi:ABC transporter permease [Seonamhaeicola sp.]|uniref:ABC transporter permease n=1 Tax=Seonamhaeicola sp. TaxID=1912245 RepID=UPI0035631374